MTPIPAKIKEWTDVDRDIFHNEIAPAHQPALLRGVAADWPAVRAARQSPQAIAEHIKSFDNGQSINLLTAPNAIGGRLFYRDDMREFNYDLAPSRIGPALDRLIAEIGAAQPAALAVQSAIIENFIPGFREANVLDLLDREIGPRIWIGNSVIVAAHCDLYYNIAVVAAGRRRFTLFPPDQLPNLYVGPMEFTPAGTPISMVSFDEPDFERYPRFKEAMASAQAGELGPGDAIYIPYSWWHHVRSLEPFNVLVNYWWNDAKQALSPTHSLLHAVLALRDMPEDQRAVWRSMFDYYVFQTDGEPLGHLPPEHRGAMGPLTPARTRHYAHILAQALGRL